MISTGSLCSFMSFPSATRYFPSILFSRRLISMQYSCTREYSLALKALMTFFRISAVNWRSSAIETASGVGLSILYTAILSMAPQIRSRTSSIRSASAWMSSRSNGVTNVVFSLRMMLWTISSASCSVALIRKALSSTSSKLAIRSSRACALEELDRSCFPHRIL